MTKKQLKQRLKDLALGAGCNWDEEHEFFEYDDNAIICIDRFASAIRSSDIPLSEDDVVYRLGLGWCKPFDDLNDLTNYIYNNVDGI